METMSSKHRLSLCIFGSYRTYEEWKLTSHHIIICCVYVLTVPMRNGNRNERQENQKLADQRSYRTYEEWKPIWFIKFLLSIVSSYRTYEEWKHVTNEAA